MKKFKDFKLGVTELEILKPKFLLIITHFHQKRTTQTFFEISSLGISSDLKIELFQINPYPDQQAKRQLR